MRGLEERDRTERDGATFDSTKLRTAVSADSKCKSQEVKEERSYTNAYYIKVARFD